ncbi:hypothetical protein NW754_005826 [Fusarium falciforme]|uniref:Cyclochlorotine biosynthesis protein O n=1 Tax=Fusarium falciforme TaxID=195108 RepID=A0A9W8RKR2_9HYPO|nr:hypothetical protein NW754_005826 [Fusarium falciforme]KAJ4198464.1 hypothetical protein NW755_001148 [Fusarium falciforme]KAJ4199014.1 hypothetical protein NW767_008598 [Fusarium falciforme]KAJ4240324.1 hypothetical protein NW757_012503 [Fusarium falciforme]
MDSKYGPVPSDEEQQFEEKSLLSPLPKYTQVVPPLKRYSTHPYIVWVCHGLLLSFSLAFFVLSLILHIHQPLSVGCSQAASPYSPADVVANYRTVRYNITPTLERTEFVGYGPEVDKAWNHVTYDVGDQMITREELDRLGLDPASLTIKNPKTGQVGYRVGIQVFHQLHCLNLLRQHSFKEYYSDKGGDIDVEPKDLRGHLDHCIEVLRTNLMCQSDTGVFTFKHYKGFESHWPDFSTLHTCRNFDAIRDWAFENAVAFGNEDDDITMVM